MCGESDDQIPPAGRSKWCAQTAAPHISATLETRKLTNRIHRWAFRRAPISTNPGGAAAFGSCLNASRTGARPESRPGPVHPLFQAAPLRFALGFHRVARAATRDQTPGLRRARQADRMFGVTNRHLSRLLGILPGRVYQDLCGPP
jgi:hypothetical protein